LIIVKFQIVLLDYIFFSSHEQMPGVFGINWVKKLLWSWYTHRYGRQNGSGEF